MSSGFDVPLAVAYSKSWAMGIVEQFDNASLIVDVSKVTLTPTELFLLSSVPANDIMASTWHKSPNWFSQGRRFNCENNKIVLTHEKENLQAKKEFELRMYEDATRADGSVICAVAYIGDINMTELSELVSSLVLIFWNKTRLSCSNQGYGLGALRGSHRFDGMHRVL